MLYMYMDLKILYVTNIAAPNASLSKLTIHLDGGKSLNHTDQT